MCEFIPNLNYKEMSMITELNDDEPETVAFDWKYLEVGKYGHKPDYYGTLDPFSYAEQNFGPYQLEGALRVKVLKYLTRYDKKGQKLKDLDKLVDCATKLRDHVARNSSD